MSGETGSAPHSKNVAQENGFYAPEVEVALNEEVEKPANPILDKLCEGKAITRDDRVALAVYIGTFIYRVPNHRAKLLALAPAAFDETVREMKDLIRSEGARRGITPEKIQRKLDQADAVRAQYADKIPPVGHGQVSRALAARGRRKSSDR